MPGPLSALLALAAASCGPATPPSLPGVTVLRVGHFPNVTHAHGLVAHDATRRGAASGGGGWFEERLGPGTRIDWFVYDAGPSAMEALLAGSLDLVYTGPSPAVNAHARSAGKEVRVLAGATRGGAALVVAGDGRIGQPADFRGRRVATPQLGNTQDVSARAWLLGQGFRVTLTGGDVQVIPTPNADLLTLFRTGGLDAAWTVEPWVSRLETEAGGKVFLEEKDALTTVLAASARFLAERPDLARRFVAAHRELTAWIREHPAEAKAAVGAELKAETGRGMPGPLLDRSWARMRWEDAVSRADFDSFVTAAVRAGTLPQAPDLAGLVVEVR